MTATKPGSVESRLNASFRLPATDTLNAAPRRMWHSHPWITRSASTTRMVFRAFTFSSCQWVRKVGRNTGVPIHVLRHEKIPAAKLGELFERSTALSIGCGRVPLLPHQQGCQPAVLRNTFADHHLHPAFHGCRPFTVTIYGKQDQIRRLGFTGGLLHQRRNSQDIKTPNCHLDFTVRPKPRRDMIKRPFGHKRGQIVFIHNHNTHTLVGFAGDFGFFRVETMKQHDGTTLPGSSAQTIRATPESPVRKCLTTRVWSRECATRKNPDRRKTSNIELPMGHRIAPNSMFGVGCSMFDLRIPKKSVATAIPWQAGAAGRRNPCCFTLSHRGDLLCCAHSLPGPAGTCEPRPTVLN